MPVPSIRTEHAQENWSRRHRITRRPGLPHDALSMILSNLEDFRDLYDNLR